MLSTEQRPFKKMRRTSASNEASLLNQDGIAKMQSGQEDEAERLFCEALGMIDGGTPFCVTVPAASYATPLKKEASTDTLLEMAAAIHGGNQSSEATKPTVTRPHYDEGLFVYSQPLSLTGARSGTAKVANILYNVGLTHVRRGNFAVAKQNFELALDKLRLGQDATAKLQARHNVSFCLYRQRKFDDALKNYKESLEDCRAASLGDLQLAHVKCGIAVLTFQMGGNAHDVLDLFNDVLSVYVTEFGPESSTVATIYNSIGRVHYMRADHGKALAAYEKALSIRRMLLGSDSIDLAATVCNIGQTQQQLGNLDAAFEFFDEFLQMPPIQKDLFNRDTAIIFMCQGEILQKRGDWLRAKDAYEKALLAGQKALGLFHEDVASTMSRLGNVHYQMRDLRGALQWYRHGLSIEKMVLDPFHKHILVTLSNMAQIHRELGQLSEALKLYDEVYLKQMRVHGRTSMEVVKTLSTMGLLEYTRKKYGAAFELYQEALLIQREIHGTEENLDVASTLNAIGLALFKLRRSAAANGYALECFNKCLKIRQTLLGETSRDVAIVWYNIATAYLEQSDDDLAIKYYKESYRVERIALGDAHPDLLMTLQHMGLVYQRKGDFTQALKHFKRALELEVGAHGKARTSVAKLLNLIGNIHLQQGNVSDMMSCYTESSRIFRQLENGNDSEDALLIAGYNFYGMSKLHPPCAPVA